MMLNQIAGNDFLMELIIMKLKVWNKGILNAHPPKFPPLSPQTPINNFYFILFYKSISIDGTTKEEREV